MKIDFTNMGIIKFNDDRTSYFLRYKIINNKLYMYDEFNKIENRKYIEVKKINNVSVSKMLKDGFLESDFTNNDSMKKFGINIYESYNITFKRLNPHTYNIYRNKNIHKLFYKNHDKNKVLDSRKFMKLKPTKGTNSLMSDFAITSAKGILTMLYNMSKTDIDREFFLNIFNTYHSVNDTIIDVENNMDMIFLSTALLLNDSNFSYIPESVVELINNSHNSYQYPLYLIGDDEYTSYENNDSIMTDGELDNRKLFNMIRNQLAHSNYEVLSDERLRVFNKGKQNRMKIEIAKKKVIFMLNNLCEFHSFDNVFPVVEDFLLNDYIQFTELTLDHYLNEINIYYPNKISFKKLQDKERQLILETDQGLDVARFKLTARSAFDKNSIQISFQFNIKKHLTDDCYLVEDKLSEEVINRIKKEINLLGKEYFYSLSKSTQIEIVHKLLHKIYNPKETYLRVACDYIENSSIYNNEALNKNASSYIDYLTLIEISIISLLNSIFLYPSNQNAIDGTCFRFPEHMYEDYLDSRIIKLQTISKTKADISEIIKRILIGIPKHNIDSSIIELLRNEIIKLNGKAKTISEQIELFDNMLCQSYDAKTYMDANNQIVKRIRDSLAHGRLTVESIDLNDIGATKLHIVDEYKGVIEFDSYVILRDLLNSINKKELVTSLVNDNTHFKNNTLIKKA